MLSQTTTKKKDIKIIDSTWTLIISFLFVGPLMLPLLWRNPRFSIKSKVLWSIGIVAFTVLLILSGPTAFLTILKNLPNQ